LTSLCAPIAEKNGGLDPAQIMGVADRHRYSLSSSAHKKKGGGRDDHLRKALTSVAILRNQT
jgi:hypothetical protein